LILAELNGKKIGPHGESGGCVSGGGVEVTVIEVEQLPPPHGVSQRVLVVPTLNDTVTVPADMPVVSSATSAPLVDESVPPVVDQVKLAPSAPVAVALNVTL
jgi:hypothetical protein